MRPRIRRSSLTNKQQQDLKKNTHISNKGIHAVCKGGNSNRFKGRYLLEAEDD
jgi:hypothetical protein